MGLGLVASGWAPSLSSVISVSKGGLGMSGYRISEINDNTVGEVKEGGQETVSKDLTLVISLYSIFS